MSSDFILVGHRDIEPGRRPASRARNRKWALGVIAVLLAFVEPLPASAGTSSASLLTRGARIVEDAARVRTARIDPNRSDRLVVHIVLATTDTSAAPIPRLQGGRATWERLATVAKGSGAPRNLTTFTATGVRKGRLTIRFPFASRMHVAWTVSQASGSVRSTAMEVLSGRDTSLSITFDRRPRGVVISGFAVGYPGSVEVEVPYVELGQSHTSVVTAIAAKGTARTVTVSWPQQGHALGYAVEIG